MTRGNKHMSNKQKGILCIILSAVSQIVTSYMIKPVVDDYVVPFIGREDVDFSGLLKMIELY